MIDNDSAIACASMRYEQDRIIDQFLIQWEAADLKERKRLPIRLVKASDGAVYIKDQKNNTLAQIEDVGDGLFRCRWVRSVPDLKLIRDVAGVKT